MKLFHLQCKNVKHYHHFLWNLNRHFVQNLEQTLCSKPSVINYYWFGLTFFHNIRDRKPIYYRGSHELRNVA